MKDLDELAKELASLEKRTQAIETTKSEKTESADLQKRTASLENKFNIAVAVAIILGLGGAGIGKLLWSATDEIQTLKLQTATLKDEIPPLKLQITALKSDIEGIDQKFESVKANTIKEITEAGKAKVLEIYKSATDIIGKIKIEQHQFCTGEYDGPCPPLPRYDPRNGTPDTIAAKICQGKKFSAPHKYREQSGGCCGYAWYDVTCFSVD